MMPGLIPAELYQWIEDRQTGLQEALVDGNTARVLELTSKMAEGAEQLREITCSRMAPCGWPSEQLPTSAGCWVAGWVRRPTLRQYRLSWRVHFQLVPEEGWGARRWIRHQIQSFLSAATVDATWSPGQ